MTVTSDAPDVQVTAARGLFRNYAILAVLMKAGRPMRVPEIVRALHEAGRTSKQNTDIQFYLSNLKKNERVDRGVYALPGY